MAKNNSNNTNANDAIEEMKRILEQSNARRAIKPDDPNKPREQGKSEGVVPMPGERK